MIRNLVLATVLFAGIVVISGVHGYILPALVSLVFLFIFLFTFYPAGRYLFSNNFNALIFAFPIGYTLHALALSLIGKLTEISTIIMLAYCAVSIGVAFLALRRRRVFEILPNGASAKEKTYLFDLLIWLIATMIVIAIPLMNVGKPTPEGFAYRAYFTSDYFRHVAVAANLSHAGIPPDNPYFSGEVLRYYWLFHIVPAFWMKIAPFYPLQYLMVQFHLVIGLMFSACLYAVVQGFFRSRTVSYFSLILFLFGGSYKGIYALIHTQQRGLRWNAFLDWNLDAILRWFWNAPEVNTLFRALLYTPQHLIGICIFLAAVLLWRSSIDSLPKRLLLYTCLFTIVGFSVIIGASVVIGCMVMLLMESIKQPRRKWKEVVSTGILGIGFLALYFFPFQMFGVKSGDLIFRLNTEIIKHFGLYLLLNWGALLPIGLAGILWGTGKMPARLLLLFLAVSFGLMLFVNINVPSLSEITLKMGFLSATILIICSAAFFDRVVLLKRGIALSVTALFVFPSFVSWTMDFYNNQDIKNRNFTTYVHHDDAALYRWISKNVEGTATVQNYSLPGKGFLADFVTEVPPLSERAIYLGDKIHSRLYQITDEQIKQRERIVWKLFHLLEPGQISLLTQRGGIEYLLFKSTDQMDWFQAALQRPYFSLAQRKGRSAIYRVHKKDVSISELEPRDLLKNEKGEAQLSVKFESNFYPPEMQTGLETSRWMSNDATLRFHAVRPVRGTLSVNVHAFQSPRTLEVLHDGTLLARREIPVRGTKVNMPIEFHTGESLLILRSIEPPGGAGSDQRSLSFLIWNLQFKQK